MANSKNNPYKVNQHTHPDPRQSLFLQYYMNPKSETFSNCLQSGLKAGYSQEYSESLTAQMPSWLSESIGDEKLIALAEKALLEALEYSTIDENGKVDSGAGRLKLDATKLVLKGLKKEKYSERTEHTGKDGEQLTIQFAEVFKKDADTTR